MDADQIPSSPTVSSLSSSDLDTESTGSFFPDRSTSLGTLMGVAFPNPAPRRPPAPPPPPDPRRRRLHRSRRSWWRLCRDESAARTSLGEFLRVEREIAAAHGGFVYGAAAEHEGVGGGALFEDGRVLPPAEARGQRGRSGEAATGARFPVLLAGICSGGEG